MKAHRIMLLALVLMFFVTSTVGAAERGPATPEERKLVSELVVGLEEAPLADQARDIRAYLLKWLIDIPDITVVMCTDFTSPITAAKHQYSAELAIQMLYGQAGFLVQQPSGFQDLEATYLAGIESVLRTYETLLSSGAQRLAYLDELLEKRQAGTLKDWVAAQSRLKC